MAVAIFDGGAGQNKLRKGTNHSIKLRNAVASHVIDWDTPFKGFGLKKPPFAGMGWYYELGFSGTEA